MARAGNPALVGEIMAISQAGRAPRNNPALFALGCIWLGPEDAAAPRWTRCRWSRAPGRTCYLRRLRRAVPRLGPQLCRAVGGWYSGKEITGSPTRC